MEDIVVQVENVHKTYGNFLSSETVLTGASLRIEKGEIVGLVGENSSKKSTLMKIFTAAPPDQPPDSMMSKSFVGGLSFFTRLTMGSSFGWGPPKTVGVPNTIPALSTISLASFPRLFVARLIGVTSTFSDAIVSDRVSANLAVLIKNN